MERVGLFASAFGKPESLGAFVRRLVGLDRAAAKRAFGAFLEGTNYTATQIAFVNHIVKYLTKNGVMEPGLLSEQPYTNLSPKGLDGIFLGKDAEAIMKILSGINANAGVRNSRTTVISG